MNWRERLEKYERSKNWKSAITFMQKTINENPCDVEAYVRMIYLLHNILVEENCSKVEHDQIAELLKNYFDKSFKVFSDNAEYLFFVGKILYIAEWYFGIEDDLKAIEERLAFRMQKSAFEKEPGNILFEWAYRFSLNEKLSVYIAEQILSHDESKIKWLKSKGFPGDYILESLRQNKENI